MFIVLMLAAIAGMGFGILALGAGMMSDAPTEGEKAANMGLILFFGGIVLFIFDFVARHNHWIS